MNYGDDAVTFRPSLVSLPPFSPSSRRRRRLSTTFVERSRPVFSSTVGLISLQGRDVNAEVASSASTIGLNGDEAIAWELFSPIHRFLIVAVVGVAVAESKKLQQICQLKKSVQLRDQMLLSMQQKLDDLCEQLNSTTKEISPASTKGEEMQLTKTFGTEKIKFVDCGCWHCEQHSGMFNESTGASVTTVSNGNQMLQYKLSLSNEEPEERRMSDLSDWASSVTSAADIQFNNMIVEQDVCNLKRDCEEKDKTIKQLSTLLSSSEVCNNKRVTELEDIVRMKNTTISKLKKDLVVLEQQVVQLTRLRRPSSANDNSNNVNFPQMRDNLIYDMESTTSPSSSDSDSTPVSPVVDAIVVNQDSAAGKGQKSAPAKISRPSGRIFERRSKYQSITPLKEASAVRKSTNAASSASQKQLSPRGDLKKSRRRSLNGAMSATAQKRLVLQ
ncbi:hypothetical protein TanjilG_05932 [Lupinus angustifolius]|uniref:Uncharacterized protein n=1 Tax=Lupinus angustifolius TaxID=3871 RepID=A0A4P1REC7_LUPAN|nr:PREDICTED: uncharacterized protein LOC109351307 isoform X2 [Lupinus angustifolius]OIW08956.1 hypothetical protein TanjilG_05932 [Lupinus angustifolius]